MSEYNQVRPERTDYRLVLTYLERSADTHYTPRLVNKPLNFKTKSEFKEKIRELLRDPRVIHKSQLGDEALCYTVSHMSAEVIKVTEYDL